MRNLQHSEECYVYIVINNLSGNLDSYVSISIIIYRNFLYKSLPKRLLCLPPLDCLLKQLFPQLGQFLRSFSLTPKREKKEGNFHSGLGKLLVFEAVHHLVCGVPRKWQSKLRLFFCFPLIYSSLVIYSFKKKKFFDGIIW